MKIGVLALQGDFAEHICIFRGMGVEAVEVRLAKDLEGLQGLVIPGGESTAIGKLAVLYDLLGPLRRFACAGAIWGTCAGMILMAKDVGADQPLLAVMDIAVQRNAFGRQVESFETDLQADVLEGGDSKPFRGVFIRAPKIVRAWGDARVIARLADGSPVAALQGRMLATAFHPELSNDDRFHALFLTLAGS
jgi:5'-phosphate synthase pdxT subunit